MSGERNNRLPEGPGDAPFLDSTTLFYPPRGGDWVATSPVVRRRNGHQRAGPSGAKMALLVLAAVNALAFHLTIYRSMDKWGSDVVAPAGARLAGLFSHLTPLDREYDLGMLGLIEALGIVVAIGIGLFALWRWSQRP